MPTAARFSPSRRPTGSSRLSSAISLGIATAETTPDLACFVRLRDRPALVRLFAPAAFFWQAILVRLAFVDFLTRGETVRGTRAEPFLC
jgi:caa(3)-type oxidase subunit IV